jgi:hypothetical protein
MVRSFSACAQYWNPVECTVCRMQAALQELQLCSRSTAAPIMSDDVHRSDSSTTRTKQAHHEVSWRRAGMLFGWELVVSFILVSVVYAVAIGEPSFGNIAPFAVGLSLVVDLFAGNKQLSCRWLSSFTSLG